MTDRRTGGLRLARRSKPGEPAGDSLFADDGHTGAKRKGLRPAGHHGAVAVKVIDRRGNEVMRVHPLNAVCR